MGFSAIARVTANKWVTCSSHDTISFGLRPGDELKVETTISQEMRQHLKAVAIDHVEKGPVYRNHPTPALYGFQSLISVPILKKNGEFFGTLTAINLKPSQVSSAAVITNFTLFADLIACHLDIQEAKDLAAEDQIREQKKMDALDAYVGILGHDLRNPLATARMSAEILLKLSKSDLNSRHANMIKSSTYRLEYMIQNIMDFCRNQMGFEMELQKQTSTEELKKSLQQVLKESYIISPDRLTNSRIYLEQAFHCDPEKIGQLFSNLLKNAEVYSHKETPFEVIATCDNGEFTLTVSGTSNEFSDLTQLKLNDPTSQYQDGRDTGKLNLEIYIASEIAKAHGGSIEINTPANEFSFTFRSKA